MQKTVKISEEQARLCGLEANDLIAKGLKLTAEMSDLIVASVESDNLLSGAAKAVLRTEALALVMDNISVRINDDGEATISCVWTFEDLVYAYISKSEALAWVLQGTADLGDYAPSAVDLAPQTGKRVKPRA